MRLLELKRQVTFTHSLNEIFQNAELTKNPYSPKPDLPYDLNDPLLRLLLLPINKLSKVLELSLLMLISQDKSLILSGKKQLGLNRLFSQATRNLLGQEKPTKFAAPTLPLTLLVIPDFISQSNFIVYELICASVYPTINHALLARYPYHSELSQELREYWSAFTVDSIESGLILAFKLTCYQSFALKFKLYEPPFPNNIH